MLLFQHTISTPIAFTRRGVNSNASRYHAGLTFLAALLLAGCATSLPRQAGATASIDDRLYFGRNIAGGGAVADADWDRFVVDAIVARFPDGHTVWRADGAWRDSTGAVIREPSFVLELIHPDDRSSDAAIEAIIAAYKKLFHQESVLWVRTPAQVRF
jgi:hypothetical protein